MSRPLLDIVMTRPHRVAHYSAGNESVPRHKIKIYRCKKLKCFTKVLVQQDQDLQMQEINVLYTGVSARRGIISFC
jgi:hypothetical protein